MPTFLNSFYPLCYTKKGLEAVNRGLPPFVDGSIRREPDFENEYPAITGLCRTNKLIPRLCKRDNVIYITNKGTYSGTRHWCLVAVLQVEEIVGSHYDTANFYRERGLAYPQNLMIPETKRKPLEETHQDNRDFKHNGIIDADAWDRAYKWRANKYPLVARCSIFQDYKFLFAPPIINEDTMYSIFGRIPGTQMPPELEPEEEIRFFDWLSHYKT